MNNEAIKIFDAFVKKKIKGRMQKNEASNQERLNLFRCLVQKTSQRKQKPR